MQKNKKKINEKDTNELTGKQEIYHFENDLPKKEKNKPVPNGFFWVCSLRKKKKSGILESMGR
jgi:hypothetical protein